MTDRKLMVFQDAVDGLVESLEATVRLSRWTGAEAKPEPLVASAGKLVARLGAAGRLATSRFHGNPGEVSKVAAMCVALKRLDAAYLTYRQRLGFSRLDVGAMVALESEVAATAATSTAWR